MRWISIVRCPSSGLRPPSPRRRGEGCEMRAPSPRQAGERQPPYSLSPHSGERVAEGRVRGAVRAVLARSVAMRIDDRSPLAARLSSGAARHLLPAGGEKESGALTPVIERRATAVFPRPAQRGEGGRRPGEGRCSRCASRSLDSPNRKGAACCPLTRWKHGRLQFCTLPLLARLCFNKDRGCPKS
jgi:hypothetical protein